MSEGQLPEMQADCLNVLADEAWVPTAWHVGLLRAAGVILPIRVVFETVDVQLFAPDPSDKFLSDLSSLNSRPNLNSKSDADNSKSDADNSPSSPDFVNSKDSPKDSRTPPISPSDPDFYFNELDQAFRHFSDSPNLRANFPAGFGNARRELRQCEPTFPLESKTPKNSNKIENPEIPKFSTNLNFDPWEAAAVDLFAAVCIW
ncbi:hypothetical protein T492DRAFT_839637 [Pavlovales sp. CCMP2436]|nr:hypothetical protein T492DRAFT_839637 [Pavlovales sp. CCMP2436]